MPEQPIIHYVCRECQEKGIADAPCEHFKEGYTKMYGEKSKSK